MGSTWSTMDAQARLSRLTRIILIASAAWLVVTLFLRLDFPRVLPVIRGDLPQQPLRVRLLLAGDTFFWGMGMFLPPIFILSGFGIVRVAGLHSGIKRAVADALLYLCFVAFAIFHFWVTTGHLM